MKFQVHGLNDALRQNLLGKNPLILHKIFHKILRDIDARPLTKYYQIEQSNV